MWVTSWNAAIWAVATGCMVSMGCAATTEEMESSGVGGKADGISICDRVNEERDREDACDRYPRECTFDFRASACVSKETASCDLLRQPDCDSRSDCAWQGGGFTASLGLCMAEEPAPEPEPEPEPEPMTVRASVECVAENPEYDYFGDEQDPSFSIAPEGEGYRISLGGASYEAMAAEKQSDEMIALDVIQDGTTILASITWRTSGSSSDEDAFWQLIEIEINGPEGQLRVFEGMRDGNEEFTLVTRLLNCIAR